MLPSLLGLLLALSPPEALHYTRGDSVTLERGSHLLTYRDLDRDGRPDLAVMTRDRRRIEIHERQGKRFRRVAVLSPATQLAAEWVVVDDVDGDGFPELGVRGERSGELYLVEATGNNTYHLARFAVGPVSDSMCVGDTNGDGRRELIVGQPGFPTRVHRFEATANDVYRRLPPLQGAGGAVFLACAPPGSRDRLRLVFADTHFWRGVARGAWFDASGRRGMWPRLNLLPTALGDTDGDGRLELIGTEPGRGLAIVDVRSRSLPRVIARDRDPSCASAPADYDGDGRIDFLCAPMVSGKKRIVVRARRGNRLVTIWDAKRLLPALSHAAVAVPGGDWNGDGRPEILVIDRGATPVIHVLLSARRGGATTSR